MIVPNAELRSNNHIPRLEFNSTGMASTVTHEATPRKNNTPIHYYYETNSSLPILGEAAKANLRTVIGADASGLNIQGHVHV